MHPQKHSGAVQRWALGMRHRTKLQPRQPRFLHDPECRCTRKNSNLELNSCEVVSKSGNSAVRKGVGRCWQVLAGRQSAAYPQAERAAQNQRCTHDYSYSYSYSTILQSGNYPNETPILHFVALGLAGRSYRSSGDTQVQPTARHLRSGCRRCPSQLSPPACRPDQCPLGQWQAT